LSREITARLNRAQIPLTEKIKMKTNKQDDHPGKNHASIRVTGWLPLIALSVLPANMLEAASGKALYAFDPWPSTGVSTGANPRGTLLRDASGALYGVASNGGPYYNGTVFKLTPPALGQTKWTITVLYNFTGGADGGSPSPNLVMDASGAIYGTASSGGSWLNDGLVFKLTPPSNGSTGWHYAVLHYFYYSYAYGADDGANPHAGLIMDQSGALYGVTGFGGSTSGTYIGHGTVFKLTPLNAARTAWTETVLYRFAGGTDGKNPWDALTHDAAGNLYGTTLYGGDGPCYDGCGTVFKLSPGATPEAPWTKTTLLRFNGQNGGGAPQGKLLLGSSGALYGTTYKGGPGQCTDGLGYVIGCGVVFRLTPPAPGQTSWTESVLLDFNAANGAFPQGGLIMDSAGALLGTTSASAPDVWGVPGDGNVFKLVPPAPGQVRWTQIVLHNFNVSTTGSTAVGELVRAPDGRLYGSAYMGGGGYNVGTIFEITP
jgi:uncharacterized repeat protein (TIGR03803 family)